MSHPSFSLDDPPATPDASARLQSDRRRSSRRRHAKRPRWHSWQQKLGLDSSVSKINLSAFCLHSAASITFLVFLNAVQPFLIAQLGVKEREGSLSGTLVFADESLSLVLALVWGSTADFFGTRAVASLSFILIALGLFSYTLASEAWPDLLFARLVFALGGSGATTMLSAILASYSDPKLSEHETSTSSPGEPNENSSLLDSQSRTDEEEDREQSITQPKSGRLAGLAGISTGIGALFAVFSLLRLPVLLSKFHGGSPKLKDLHQSFWLVAGLSLLVSLLLSFGLKPAEASKGAARIDAEERAALSGYGSTSTTSMATPASQDPNSREARRQRLLSRRPTSRMARVQSASTTLIKGTLSGFSLASNDAELVLAYLGGSLARAATIGTTVFVPLIVARFFYHSGKCPTLPPDDSSPDELKRICRQAYTLASAISGVIQLFALLLAPLIGHVCDLLSPVVTLGFTSLIGVVAFSILGVNLSGEGNGDPRSILAWISAVCVGLCQIGAIVSSLVLIQRAKARAGDKAGSIAGAYSSTGGLSVLVTSKLGGFLFDLWSPSPFLLIAGLAFIVTGASIIVHSRTKVRTQ